MKKKRFDTLASSPVRWAYEAHRQFLVGSSLVLLNESAIKEFILKTSQVPSTPEHLECAQKNRAYVAAVMLHFGLAIENAHKAKKLLTGQARSVDGVIKGLRTNHDITAMVDEYKVSLNDRERDIVYSITFATISGAKYPIALNNTKQANFSGRVYGDTVTKELVERICIEILKDTDYISIFQKGALSKIPDTA